MSNVHPLENKIIQSIQITDDKHALKFITDKGEVLAVCYGDCCSHTWIEHINTPALGFPAKVISIENRDMPEPEEKDWELIRFYGIRIITDKGDIDIEYRNSSNGYYGGDLRFPDQNEMMYSGVFDQNEYEDSWSEVEDM